MQLLYEHLTVLIIPFKAISLMGVSLVGLAVLLISFAVHIFHIAQRVKQNRIEREEKVGL